MQPQDPLQPQQPNAMPVPPAPPVQPMPVAPAPPQPTPFAQPGAAMQQPVAPQVIGTPVPVQPAAPSFGAPLQPQAPLPPMGGGMPMLKMGGGRSVKKILIPIAVVLVAVGVFLGLRFLKDPYPSYKQPTEITFADHKVATFTDWVKKKTMKAPRKPLPIPTTLPTKRVKIFMPHTQL